MHSLGYLYRAFGDKQYADQAELAAFNALPAAVSPDWWSHQYVTQINQVGFTVLIREMKLTTSSHSPTTLQNLLSIM